MSANNGAVGLPVTGIETPALCLDVNVYRRNVARMAAFISGHSLSWRPHMKGQKAPELALEALGAGAIGVTCATVYEAEAMVDAGVHGVLVAHQIAGERKLARLARLQRAAPVVAATDSLEHVRMLAAAAREGGVVIPVVIEVDIGMKRCGAPPGQPSVELAGEISRSGSLRFAGLMGWEGHTVPLEGAEKRRSVTQAIAGLAATAAACRASGLAPEIVSSSGSATFHDSAGLEGITEVQAGGGVFSDLRYQKWGLDHEFALTVLTRVVSRPTPGRIIVDGGFKAMSVQHGPPKALGIGALKSLVLSAEHGTLELEQPDVNPRVGDAVAFVPGYTDSTVCLHDEMCVVRDGVVEAVWAIPGRTGRR